MNYFDKASSLLYKHLPWQEKMHLQRDEIISTNTLSLFDMSVSLLH